MPSRFRTPIVVLKTAATATAKAAGAVAVLLYGVGNLLPTPVEQVHIPSTTVLDTSTTSTVVETLRAVVKPTVSVFVSNYDYDAPSEMLLRIVLYSVWIAALTMGLVGVLQGIRLGHQWLK